MTRIPVDSVSHGSGQGVRPVEIRRQLAIARSWIPLLIVFPLVAAGIAFLVTSSQQPVYQVSSQLLPQQFLPGNPESSNVSLSRAFVLTTNFAFVARSRDLLSSVRGELNIEEPLELLAKRVDAVVDPTTAGLTITARASDPSEAQALANAVAREVQARSSAVSDEASLVADLETVRTRLLVAEAEYERLLALPAPRATEDELALANSLGIIRELTSVYDSLNASRSSAPGGLSVVEEAAAEGARKIAPLTLQFTLLALVAGLLLAAGLASILEYLDDRVKDPETIEDVAGLSTLGTIAQMKGGQGEIYRLAALLYPRSAMTEAYRALRSNIEFAAVDAPIRTLLVTSSVAGEGKTITAANLAVVFAQAGRRVLLVDADLRNPGLQVAFKLPNAAGLTTLIRNDGLSLDAISQPTEQTGLRILTSGPLPPNPAELLGSNRMRTVLEQFESEVDLVVIDSAPLRGLTDSAILSSYADGTVLVIDARRSRRPAVRQSREILAKAGADVLGAVLNRIPEKAHASRYGYHGDTYGSEVVQEKPA